MRALSSLAVLVSLLPFIVVPGTNAVKTHDFKTCSQAAFCRRGRALSSRASQTAHWNSPYSLDPTSLKVSTSPHFDPSLQGDGSGAVLSAAVKSALYPEINFGLEVRVLDGGVVRVRMDEVGGLRQRYNEAASWALVKEPQLSKNVKWAVGNNEARAKSDDGSEVVVQFAPLKVTLYRGGEEEVVLNGLGLLHMEHFRSKGAKLTDGAEEMNASDAQQVLQSEGGKAERAWFEGEEEDGYWEESFGSHHDSKPKGPESLSLDITFPSHPHVYGIPQHASPLSLPTTTGPNPHYTDPYRLYNSDVFEYLADSTMSLYGSIPLMHAHSKKSTVGVFVAVGSDTWVDVAHESSPFSSQASASKPGEGSFTHWISESGILDVFLLPGPTPEAIFSQYASLVGTQALPPTWALAYHQCRWNYVSSSDVREVAKRFDEADMPVDVLWLDIEYSEEHKYFIWDKKNFPDPVEMVDDVAAAKRKMVVIIDPHLKRTSNYPVYNEAQQRGVLVKNSKGDEYEGWCWSGSSAWVDFFHPDSWSWWQGLFKNKKDNTKDEGFRWLESTDDVYIWNDMNEPSVFNGPEISMPRDNIHHGGWEHRDLHNINGMLYSNQTATGVMLRSDPPKRPFVLTRSFYAGSQRFGAMWTGDNLGTYEHMAVGAKMVLSMNLAGFAFSGSDVGGFFGNPDPDMLVRWYTIGIFTPFFRAHAHIDTKRREPYLYNDFPPYGDELAELLRVRYAMLPVWSGVMREASVTGMPAVRPQWVMFPQDEAGFAIDDQYYIGNTGLLFKVIAEPDKEETNVYLAENQVYYHYFHDTIHHGSPSGNNVTIPAHVGTIPLLVRGGSIIPTRERPRRSSPLMAHDPFTLRVALSNTGSASGELYLDDGESFEHLEGNIVWRGFTAEKKNGKTILKSRDLVREKPAAAVSGVVLDKYSPSNKFAKSIEDVGIEKIIVLGLARNPAIIRAKDGQELEWTFEEANIRDNKEVTSKLTIKKPVQSIIHDWEITILESEYVPPSRMVNA